MTGVSEPERAEAEGDAELGGFRCDFCGETVPKVRRIALDRDYERLQTPHRTRYACPDCSTRKERDRGQRAG